MRVWIYMCYAAAAANAFGYPRPFNVFVAGLCLGAAVVAHLAYTNEIVE